MEKLLENIRKSLNESKIEKIIITSQEGDYQNPSLINFVIIYNDGKRKKYQSRVSPYLLGKFITKINHKSYGQAMNLIKGPDTYQIDEKGNPIKENEEDNGGESQYDLFK